MTLTWRSLTVDDVPAVTDLANLTNAADGTGGPVSQASVREQFDYPRSDAESQTVTVWDGPVMVAGGSAWPKPEPVDGRAMCYIDFDVRPDRRSPDLDQAMLDRLLAMAPALAADRVPGRPIRVRTSGGLSGSERQRLLEAAGFTPDNYFIAMEVVLEEWTDPGTASSAVAPGDAATPEVLDAHNDAFRDHRNFSPIPADAWQHWVLGAGSRPDLSRVVLDGERVLAYAMVHENEPGVAHIEIIGTRREARGRGLARQALVASLRASRAAGMRVSDLEVDSTSPTGADRLYASVGFTPVRTISRYILDLPG